MMTGLDHIQQRVEAAAARALGAASVTGLDTIHGGASSVTLLAHLAVEDAERMIVVKVAPDGLAPVRNRDVLRQARVLRALGPTRVPVPAVLFDDPGDPPDVPPLFAMEHVKGTSEEPVLDLADPPDGATVRARELACAGTLGALHAVAPGDVGLDTEPPLRLEDELDRWVRLAASAGLEDDAADVVTALRATLPVEAPPVILHGDFRLGNLLSGPDGTRAVIDWEIWALGDARIDLAWYLLSTRSDRNPAARHVVPGMPEEEELLGAYGAARGGPSPADLEWFAALAHLKGGAIAAGNMKKQRRSGASNPVVAAWPADLPLRYFREARRGLAAT